ncbi:response regulator [Aliiglaciecola litoralis]|uniref:Response regulatory domain-containing protein n=1 Tax=Aliiglaciecola litoralis TaxID=582857 RepID=A0ABN1LCP1_9ALTE
MTADKTSNIVLFETSPEADALVLEILKKHALSVIVCTELKEVCRLLVDKSEKVFLMTGDTLEKSLHPYYRSLDAVKSYDICEHRVVSLIPRQSEPQAYEAYKARIIDDYMVSRPIYEMHRIVMICEHLLIELGVNNLSAEQFNAKPIKQVNLQDEILEEIVKQGMARKDEIQHAFEDSIIEIDNALESAAQKVQNNQPVKLDIEKLKETLASIRSNEIRPELIRLQEKAIKLLSQSLNIQQQEEPVAEASATAEDKPAKPKPKETYAFNRLYQQNVDPDALLKEAEQIPTILLVEDDVISVHLTRKLLGTYKFNIETVANGRQAYACLTSKKYDLVLMDISLPDTNGIYIVDQATNGDSLNKETPIIMLSGNKSKSIISKALERGAKGYVIKPLNKTTVDKLIAKYFKNRVTAS